MGKTGIDLISEERKRQQAEEGWTLEHDQGHRYGELGSNAAALAVDGTDFHLASEGAGDFLGSEFDFGLVYKHGYAAAYERGLSWCECRVRALTIAGALIAAEIDRELAADQEADHE